MRSVADTILYLALQLPLLVFLVLVRLGWKVVGQVGRALDRAYYGVVVLRRQVRGEQLWQAHDALLGREHPPPP